MDVARVRVRARDGKLPLDGHVRIVARDVGRRTCLGCEEDIVGHRSEREPDNVAGAHPQRGRRKRDGIRGRDRVGRWMRYGRRTLTTAPLEYCWYACNIAKMRL